MAVKHKAITHDANHSAEVVVRYSGKGPLVELLRYQNGRFVIHCDGSVHTICQSADETECMRTFLAVAAIGQPESQARPATPGSIPDKPKTATPKRKTRGPKKRSGHA
jgi:hypothetical protein